MSYSINTWDFDKQAWTPQIGVPEVVQTQWDLKRALRKLHELGYNGKRPDPYVLVEQFDNEQEAR